MTITAEETIGNQIPLVTRNVLHVKHVLENSIKESAGKIRRTHI